MKIGSLVYSTIQGLGILAKALVDNGIITHPMVIRHGRHPHQEWFPGAPVISDLLGQRQLMEEHCRSVDVMLFLETPFEHSLIPHCKQHGVKTTIMPMHECWHKATPLPDLFLCPSLLDVQVFTLGWKEPMGFHVDLTPFSIYERDATSKVAFTPVPVEVPWRQRTEASVFVHNAGNGGLRGRNGALELVTAWPLVKSPAKLIIRAQEPLGIREKQLDPRIEYRFGTLAHEELWRDGGEGDVFCFPEKFNGLSLPLQEARAAGMLVMCGDRFPMNAWLPTAVDTHSTSGYETLNPLIPVTGYSRARIGPAYLEFDEASFDPRVIAAKVDEWFGRDVTDYSLSGKKWAEENSWDVLGPKYIAILEELCQ